jgi:glucosylglycerate phosphorylase
MLSPQVFAVLRSSPKNDRHVLALTNVTALWSQVVIPLRLLPTEDSCWEDLIGSGSWIGRDGTLALALQPYDVIWLKPQYQSASPE